VPRRLAACKDLDDDHAATAAGAWARQDAGLIGLAGLGLSEHDRTLFERVLGMLRERPGEPPRCASCAGVLKPDVVFFGELLPEREVERAYELARSAGLMLVVGSSLEVFPVAGLPHETLDAGGKVAIVNLGPTPLDRQADVKIEESAAEVLPEVLRIVTQRSA